MAALPGSAGFQPAGWGIFQMPVRWASPIFDKSAKMRRIQAAFVACIVAGGRD
jgi:hypothetical protein